jgi:5-methylcytosine-specific restriction endonuclease McrA
MERKKKQMVFINAIRNKMNIVIFLIALIFVVLFFIFNRNVRQNRRLERKQYYNEVYLKSDAWKRKRYVVLKRDNWTCVYCGRPANQVHHKKYARVNIGREPIEWLESVCSDCHNKRHLN